MRESFKADIAELAVDCQQSQCDVMFCRPLLVSTAAVCRNPHSFLLTPEILPIERWGSGRKKVLFSTEAITFLFRGAAAGPQSSH